MATDSGRRLEIDKQRKVDVIVLGVSLVPPGAIDGNSEYRSAMFRGLGRYLIWSPQTGLQSAG
jgi:hypothetical protein